MNVARFLVALLATLAFMLTAGPPITRRLLFGRKVLECQCGEQFRLDHARRQGISAREVYNQHWSVMHSRDAVGTEVMAHNPNGGWSVAIPEPGYFRERDKADW